MTPLKIILISFADGVFANRKKEFVRQAKLFGLFDEIIVYDNSMLDEEFRRAHLNFLQTTDIGFGYFIWKPQVIKQTLRRTTRKELIVYMDVGFTLNSAGVNRFTDYIELVKDSKYKFLAFQNVYTEYEYCKMDLAERLNVRDNATIMKTSQFSGGFLLLIGTRSNKILVDKWLKLATESNYKFSDYSPSVIENHSEFVQHRSDQSILSLLLKIRGGNTVTHYEVQNYKNFDNNKTRFPAWATRLRE